MFFVFVTDVVKFPMQTVGEVDRTFSKAVGITARVHLAQRWQSRP